MPTNTDLKSTIRLPRTPFSMKANLPRREPETLDWWDRIDLDGLLRAAREGRPTWVLHDGPPYANGHIHIGQALNKVLKDVAVKSHSMAGRDARYVPGWDCHGLPIEHRVDKELGRRKGTLDALEVRRRCREYAEKFIDVQRGEFRRLGVLWNRALDGEEERADAPSRRAIYRTIDRTYEAEIVRQLGGFFTAGGVYHGVKPVHWCPSCRTALAEAEVEYARRTDPSVFVAFPARGLDARVPELSGRDVAVVIWTTTPWTLPANLAIALHPDLTYVAVEVGPRTFIVAEGLLQPVAELLGWGRPAGLARFTGRQLVGEGGDWIGAAATIERPYPAPDGPGSGPGVLLLGEHVSIDRPRGAGAGEDDDGPGRSGTGCVHTAPGHGADDFEMGRRYGLEPFNPVDDAGRFRADRVTDPRLAGAFVLDANATIIDDLRQRGWLLHHEDYPHSYPHCWRCSSPVLFRATPQWFISMEANDLRGRAVEAIHRASWLPAFGETRISQMIETRPDWCISRQRTWGVPIPAVVCGACIEQQPDAFLRDRRLFEHLERLFGGEGSDAWFGLPDGEGGHRPYPSAAERLARLVPEGLACPRCGRRERLELHDHIVDVWFESGVSHAAVLGRDPRLPWPADLYLEGHDQYRGWFHSSLLVAVQDRDEAPYRGVVTHGFTLDAAGLKMSKSRGNVVSPMEIADRRGAEILRLWVSMIDFLEDMRISDEVLTRNAESYRKIRNTFRYLLGNLHGFDPAADALPYERLQEIDRWALQQLERLRRRLTAAYDAYQYHIVYHGLVNFCAVTLSSFYLDVLKDRLYTQPPRSAARRSAQTVLQRLARDLCRLMAPVLCFTAEEVWQELETLAGRPAWADRSVHTELFPAPLEADDDAALLERWLRVTAVRDEVAKALEAARRDKTIGGTLEARVVIEAPDELRGLLASFGDDLRFLLLVSEVELGPAGDGAFRSDELAGLAIRVERAGGDKCQRCWMYTRDVGSDADWPTVCARCAGAVREILSGAGPA